MLISRKINNSKLPRLWSRHISPAAEKTTHTIYGVSVDSTGMFFSEIFMSSVLGGFFGGILIWLLMKILESRQNGLKVPQKVPREHDERH